MANKSEMLNRELDEIAADLALAQEQGDFRWEEELLDEEDEILGLLKDEER